MQRRRPVHNDGLNGVSFESGDYRTFAIEVPFGLRNSAAGASGRYPPNRRGISLGIRNNLLSQDFAPRFAFEGPLPRSRSPRRAFNPKARIVLAFRRRPLQLRCRPMENVDRTKTLLEVSADGRPPPEQGRLETVAQPLPLADWVATREALPLSSKEKARSLGRAFS